ncbi:hypothetical protein NFI96_026363, partial [Prochilodus magdalenae]
GSLWNYESECGLKYYQSLRKFGKLVELPFNFWQGTVSLSAFSPWAELRRHQPAHMLIPMVKASLNMRYWLDWFASHLSVRLISREIELLAVVGVFCSDAPRRTPGRALVGKQIKSQEGRRESSTT